MSRPTRPQDENRRTAILALVIAAAAITLSGWQTLIGSVKRDSMARDVALSSMTPNQPVAKRYLVDWHDELGKRVVVAVIPDQDCPGYQGRGCAQIGQLQQGFAAVYLGRNERRLPHELAHIAGMRHTAWQRNGLGTECALVTAAGYQTGYSVGDVICAGFDGSDVR
jgi:hypothetical protein